MADAPPPEILLSEQQIQKRVAELAAEIRRDFPDDVHLVAVLLLGARTIVRTPAHDRGHHLDFMATSWGEAAKEVGVKTSTAGSATQRDHVEDIVTPV